MFRTILCTIFILLSLTAVADEAAKATLCDEAIPSDSTIVHFLRDKEVRFSRNNRLVIFKNGQEKFDDLFNAVRQARHSIHLEYFNFRNDSISKELFTLLTERAKAGVKVRALFDAFGNSSNNRPLRERHLDSLRRRGIEIYEFDPMNFPWVNHALHRDHRKIVVIDGMIAYTGGMNVADYYIKGKPEFGDWRDIHVRVEGDVVGELQAIFLKTWNNETHQNISGPEYYPGEKKAEEYFADLKRDTCATAGRKMIGVVDREPYYTPRIIHDTFVKAIDSAQRSIRIINPYFTLCGHLRRALRRAVKRGVDVEIMVSAKSDIPVTPRIVEYNTRRLMKRGAKIFFYEGGFHHSKIMMVDSLYSFIGSANLNSRSLSFDYECNLLVADAPTTLGLISIFERDKAERCFPLTDESWKDFSRWRRFKGWLFHFLAPVVENDKQLQPLSGMEQYIPAQIQ